MFSPSRRVYSSQHKPTLTLNRHTPCILQQFTRPVVALKGTNVYHSFPLTSTHFSARQRQPKPGYPQYKTQLVSRRANLPFIQHSRRTLHFEHGGIQLIAIAIISLFIPPKTVDSNMQRFQSRKVYSLSLRPGSTGDLHMSHITETLVSQINRLQRRKICD